MVAKIEPFKGLLNIENDIMNIEDDNMTDLGSVEFDMAELRTAAKQGRTGGSVLYTCVDKLTKNQLIKENVVVVAIVNSQKLHRLM